MMTTIAKIRRRLVYFYCTGRYWWEGVEYRLGFYRGLAPTPHAVKRRIILNYAKRYGTTLFVETGTYMGDMIAAMRRHFDRLYTIELSTRFYENAVSRFARHKNVRVLQGDSGKEIGRLLSDCDRHTLFWLDAHWSGGRTARGEVDTPVVSELDQILEKSKLDPVILIDDARCFVGTDGYPTIEEIRRRVHQWRSDYEVDVQNDVIRITPPLNATVRRE